jgi:hypothetical protein
MIALLLVGAAAAQFPGARDALRLGRTQDEAVYTAFSKGYELTAAEPVTSAEIVTEFRRAVMIARARAQQGEYGFTERDLVVAMQPHLGRITFIVQVKLHPFNTYQKAPTYELYVSTGSGTAPLAGDQVTREPVYGFGGPGSPVVGVRLEITVSRDRLAAAPAPELIVTDEHADILWRGRIDLPRFR